MFDLLVDNPINAEVEENMFVNVASSCSVKLIQKVLNHSAFVNYSISEVSVIRLFGRRLEVTESVEIKRIGNGEETWRMKEVKPEAEQKVEK